MTPKQIDIYMDWRNTGDSYTVLGERHSESLHGVKQAIDKGLAARKPKRINKPKPPTPEFYDLY